MAEHTPGTGGGLLDSLANLAATLVAIIHTRLDLLASDLEEERAHLVSQLVLVLVGLFFLGIGILLATMLLVAAFWDTHRLLVLGLLTGFFLVAGIGAWAMAMHKARTKPKLFAASMSELLKDRQQLTDHDEQNPVGRAA